MIRRIALFVLLSLPAGIAHAAGAPGLAIVDAYFEDYDRTLVREQQLRSGDTLYVTFHIAGYRPDDQHRVRLSYQIDCFDPQNVRLAETFSEKIEQTLAPEDEKWRPKINWSLGIPAFAPSGEYHVAIQVRDEIAGQEARHQMTFRVQGEAVEPSAALAVRNFEFADTEDGKPKTSPIYSRGSALWARFRVLGFRISDDKQISVEEDLGVLDAEGKVLFSKPQAAVEKYRMFYPPRFLTAAFNLELKRDLRPGEYTIRLDVRDLLGEQNTRFETKFTVQE